MDRTPLHSADREQGVLERWRQVPLRVAERSLAQPVSPGGELCIANQDSVLFMDWDAVRSTEPPCAAFKKLSSKQRRDSAAPTVHLFAAGRFLASPEPPNRLDAVQCWQACRRTNSIPVHGHLPAARLIGCEDAQRVTARWEAWKPNSRWTDHREVRRHHGRGNIPASSFPYGPYQ